MSFPTSHSAAILRAPRCQHEIGIRATPSISSNEVVIKITATAINPVDWKLRDLLGDVLTYPAVLGSDAAGEVVRVDDDVTDFVVGDRVFFQGIINNSDASTFQQYYKMPAALVGKTPAISATALYAESGHGIQPPWSKGGEKVGRGKAIIVLGGSSSVGQYAIQLAQISGFEGIVTNSSSTHFSALRSLGVTVVLGRSTATPEEYGMAVGGLEVRLVLDAISTEET